MPAGSNYNLGGFVSYNGWTFFPPRFNFGVQMRPEFSDDGRTTVANIYTFHLVAIVTDDPNGVGSHLNLTTNTASRSASTDTIGHTSDLMRDTWNARGNLQKIRSLLSKNGGELWIKGFGFDLHVNGGGASSQFDVRWGPKTLDLQFKQIGNGVVWEVSWLFEVSLPECYNASGSGTLDQTSGVASDAYSYINFPYIVEGASQMSLVEQLSFTVAYTVSPSGLTIRVIEGMIAIPLNRASVIGRGNFTQITNTADDVWELIQPEVPPGFQRMVRQRTLSSNMASLRFQIVDQELASDNPIPDGIVDIQVDHTATIADKIIPGAMPIACRISGFIEVVKGYPIGYAFSKIVLIMQQRIDWAKRVWSETTGRVVPYSKIPVFVTGVEVTESLYGPRKVVFGINYIIQPGANRVALYANLINVTGLFQPVIIDSLSWSSWKKSMLDFNIWTPRGVASLAMIPSNAPIVGPCDIGTSYSLNQPFAVHSNTNLGNELVSGCPPVGFDYLKWKNVVTTKVDGQTVIHQPMQRRTVDNAIWGVIDGTLDAHTAFIGYMQASDSIRAASPVRYSTVGAASVLHVVYTGEAVRMGNPIEVPTFPKKLLLDKIKDGKIVKDVRGNTVSNTRVGTMGRCPVFAGSWRVGYTLTGTYTSDELAAIIDTINNATNLTESDDQAAKTGGYGNQSSSSSPSA